MHLTGINNPHLILCLDLAHLIKVVNFILKLPTSPTLFI